MTRHHTPQRTFRVSKRVWSVFVATCVRNDTSATSVLRQAITAYLLEHGTSRDELAGLITADAHDLDNEPHPKNEPTGARA